MDIFKIVNYFIHIAKPNKDIDPEWEEYDFTHLKLQKLLYYAQGFSLIKNKRPLFKEKILAWEHGPVVKEVYKKYKKYGSDPIKEEVKDEDIAYISNDIDTKLILDSVYSLYGQYSAYKLRQDTHDEYPWESTRRNGTISHDKLKKYFKLVVA